MQDTPIVENNGFSGLKKVLKLHVRPFDDFTKLVRSTVPVAQLDRGHAPIGRHLWPEWGLKRGTPIHVDDVLVFIQFDDRVRVTVVVVVLQVGLRVNVVVMVGHGIRAQRMLFRRDG